MEISLIKTEAITKSEIFDLANAVKDKLQKGEISGLLLKQHFKAIEKVADFVKKELDKAAIAEAGKYPDKQDIILYGATFKLAEFGVTYDYAGCKDPVWERLKEEADAATKALKDRQTFLLSIKGHESVVDEQTGEIATVYPPVRKSTTNVSCTI